MSIYLKARRNSKHVKERHGRHKKDPIKWTCHRQSVKNSSRLLCMWILYLIYHQRKGEGKEEIMAKNFHQTSKVYSRRNRYPDYSCVYYRYWIRICSYKFPRSRDFTGEFYRTFKWERIPILILHTLPENWKAYNTSELILWN